MNDREGLSKDQIIDALNHSGYPFEKSIEDAVCQANKEGSPWRLMGRNYAVQFQGSQREIDSILGEEGILSLGTVKKLLIVECKRAHPDYKVWVFFERVNPLDANVRCILLYEDEEHGSRFRLARYRSQGAFTLLTPFMRNAIEVRYGKRGDKTPCTTKQIEEACLQVTIGSLALAEEYLLAYRQEPQVELIVPVVVTTAKLKKVSLKDENGAVGISDGNIDQSKAEELEEIPWAYLQRSVPLPALVGCGSGGKYQIEQPSWWQPFEENSIHILVVNSDHFKEFLVKARGFQVIPAQ